jgi:hypothetical protein
MGSINLKSEHFVLLLFVAILLTTATFDVAWQAFAGYHRRIIRFSLPGRRPLKRNIVINHKFNLTLTLIITPHYSISS